MDPGTNHILLPQAVKYVLAQLGNISHAGKICKDLEGSNVHPRLHLDVLQSVGDQLVRNDH